MLQCGRKQLVEIGQEIYHSYDKYHCCTALWARGTALLAQHLALQDTAGTGAPGTTGSCQPPILDCLLLGRTGLMSHDPISQHSSRPHQYQGCGGVNPPGALQKAILHCWRASLRRGTWYFRGSVPALQYPPRKWARASLDWGVLGMPIARPGVLRLVWSRGAVLYGAGEIFDGRVRFPMFLGEHGCPCGSISLEAQLRGAFPGRGMARGRQGRAFSP